jgi:hypothetical protein
VISAETAGSAAPDVIALLCVSAVAGVLFCRQERRAAHPLLDLRYLRVPQFLTANVVALCAYFATFAVFFFTALYLAEVAGYSGYHIALIFLPMTALMTLTSVLARAVDGHGRVTLPGRPRLRGVRRRPAADRGHHQSQPAFRAARRGARRDRHRGRRHRRADHLLRAVGRAARAVRDGRVGGQHQPRDRRRARRAGQLPAALVLATGLFTPILLRKPGLPPGDTSNPLLADASGPSGSR